MLQDVFQLLLRSLDDAQATILRHNGGLTTICVALICPLKSASQHAVCVVSVGDSLAFVLSRRHGMREITTGSRDVTTERDIRDAGGALGPVRNGTEPELHNLTLSMTLIDPGDIVLLTTDGISDNFDPVVTKIAVSSTKMPASLKAAQTSISKDKINSTPPQGVSNEIQSSGKCSENGDGTVAEKNSSELNISDAEVPPKSSSNLDLVDPKTEDMKESCSNQNGTASVTNQEEKITETPVEPESQNCVPVTADLEIQPSATEQQVPIAGDAEETCDQEEAEQLRLRLEACDVNQLIMTPTERHWYAVKEMERIIHEFELFAECSCSAQELTGALLQHVLKLTDSKRKVIIRFAV